MLSQMLKWEKQLEPQRHKGTKEKLKCVFLDRITGITGYLFTGKYGRV